MRSILLSLILMVSYIGLTAQNPCSIRSYDVSRVSAPGEADGSFRVDVGDLAPGNYHVIVVGDNGQTCSVNTEIRPACVAPVISVNRGGSGAYINWDPLSEADNYLINICRRSNAACTEVETPAGYQLRFADTSGYVIRVRSLCNADTSDYSNLLQISTVEPLSCPTPTGVHVLSDLKTATIQWDNISFDNLNPPTYELNIFNGERDYSINVEAQPFTDLQRYIHPMGAGRWNVSIRTFCPQNSEYMRWSQWSAPVEFGVVNDPIEECPVWRLLSNNPFYSYIDLQLTYANVGLHRIAGRAIEFAIYDSDNRRVHIPDNLNTHFYENPNEPNSYIYRTITGNEILRINVAGVLKNSGVYYLVVMDNTSGYYKRYRINIEP